MVRITEQLIRKKSEHNELIIGTLEELSLHQEDIEKIEHLQNWCRNLKILLLQYNLIPKIENIFKLKNLEYLNLAVNNIERIENVEELESLEKLDLTLNFIGILTSVDCLKDNYNLKHLTLTGNPCTDFDGYRDYVIVVLPQLESLDGIVIKRSDRILASNNFAGKRAKIVQLETEYCIRRDEQRIRIYEQQELEARENAQLNEEEIDEKFWKRKSEHCPETRIEISNQQRKVKKSSDKQKKDQPKRIRKLFADCGRPFNINEARVPFRMIDERDRYELNVEVYRFLDTSLLHVDVESNYVRVTMKGKIFQVALKDEIQIEKSTSQRSMTTGHLLITMPKLNYKTPIHTDKSKDVINHDGSVLHNESRNNQETVDYKHIVSKYSTNISTSKVFEDTEIPSLI
ncbi:protein tilB isoform X1 [Bradysia coprophila]|uniref:protein tilB isoform X1 n=1 Tax=Bradysia coprophila TaxID=38358 RepID=UPI00187D893C|nr:protein tilB isoform X1 [Bradysia coprophila]